jgi:perosamine synthetase
MADVDRLNAIAARHGMQVIEDAAHAFPAYTRRDASSPWRSAGTTAPLTCFSFYANKCITTGEGGILVAQDAALADRARIMSLHGLSKSAWSRFESRGSWYYEILAPGFKYNLTDVAAAIGRVQLHRADAFWRARRRIAALYHERLADLADWVETPVELADRQSSWHLYPVRLHLDRLAVDRAAVIEALKEKGITCSVHWMPLHLHPYYREVYGTRAEDHPVASAEWPRLISLPIFPSMSDTEVEYVCASLREIVITHRRGAERRAGARG